MSAPAHLILFARAPVAGATKTRLAQEVGAEAARDFHVACLLDEMDVALAWQATAPETLGRPVCLHAFVTPPDSAPAFLTAGAPWPAAFRLHNQVGATLGERMDTALRTVLREAPGLALLTGTDVPLLERGLLTAATQALQGADVVFGPAPDGGYYLIGLNRPAPDLFSELFWGGSSVLEASLRAADALGLRVAHVTQLPDVDTANDVLSVLAHPLAFQLKGRRALKLLHRWVEQGLVRPD
jgi:hypothetical protein